MSSSNRSDRGSRCVVAGLLFAQRVAVRATPSSFRRPRSTHRGPAKTETAVFAGGCFWGIQSVFQHTKGVTSATSGYAGGWTDKPSYEEVSSGRTGHAESVRVVVRSVAGLVSTSCSRSSSRSRTIRRSSTVRVRTSARSIGRCSFYMTDEQKQTAEAYINQLNEGARVSASRS